MPTVTFAQDRVRAEMARLRERDEERRQDEQTRAAAWAASGGYGGWTLESARIAHAQRVALYARDPDRAWMEAIREAVAPTARRLGLDPDSMLDIDRLDENDEPVGEGLDFLPLLDDLVTADPTTDQFRRAVEAAVFSYAAGWGERVTEATMVEHHTEEEVGTVLKKVGGRKYKMRILKAGTSRNGNTYPVDVLREAARLYEGSRAYDHHRTPAELQSSTVRGLIGSFHSIEVDRDGLTGVLELLPSAKQVAEALDLSLANQSRGLPPLVGVSHDVMADFAAPTHNMGRRTRVAKKITAVQSVDVVADPSAGGGVLGVLEARRWAA